MKGKVTNATLAVMLVVAFSLFVTGLQRASGAAIESATDQESDVLVEAIGVCPTPTPEPPDTTTTAADQHPHRDADQHTDQHPHRDADQHADQHPHRDADQHADQHPHRDADQHADQHPHRHADATRRRTPPPPRRRRPTRRRTPPPPRRPTNTPTNTPTATPTPHADEHTDQHADAHAHPADQHADPGQHPDADDTPGPPAGIRVDGERSAAAERHVAAVDPCPPETTEPKPANVAADVVVPVIARGATQTGHGTGFQPGEVVTAEQQSVPLSLGTQTANAEGDGDVHVDDPRRRDARQPLVHRHRFRVRDGVGVVPCGRRDHAPGDRQRRESDPRSRPAGSSCSVSSSSWRRCSGAALAARGLPPRWRARHFRCAREQAVGELDAHHDRVVGVADLVSPRPEPAA